MMVECFFFIGGISLLFLMCCFFPPVINAMIDPDRFLDNWYDSKCSQGTSNAGSFETSASQGLDDESPNTKGSRFKDASLGSESDFSIHFNKFNPDEDGPCYV